MALEKCENCKFYLTDDFEVDGITYERDFGLCRRFPPKRIDEESGFPMVEQDDWCGEYKNTDPQPNKKSD